jgi:uncharacterized protein YdaU (DUF1376 family)
LADHWTAIYWSDYLRKTSGLKMLEHGAYFLLLAEYYSAGYLPANVQQLLFICRATTAEEQEAVKLMLWKYFYLDPNDDKVYRNKRADEELKKSSDIQERRRLAGSRGGKATKDKLSKRAASAAPIATANASHLPQTATPTPTVTNTRSKSTSRPSASKGRIPDERHTPFRLKLEKFWLHLNPGSETYQWDAGDAGQLGTFLKKWPDMKIEEFHQWLVNYEASEGILEAKTPREFLPKLHLYKQEPLNGFLKPLGKGAYV